MKKNKLILSKTELVEIITSTVTTIQEQDLISDYVGNFGGLFNWKWSPKLHGGEDYSPSAYVIPKSESNGTRSVLEFTGEELSTWDTGLEEFNIAIRLTPADIIKKLNELQPELWEDEKIKVTIKSFAPYFAGGTNKLRWWIRSPKTKKGWSCSIPSCTNGDGRKEEKTLEGENDAVIDLTWTINVDPAEWYNISENETGGTDRGTYNWAIGATAKEEAVLWSPYSTTMYPPVSSWDGGEKKWPTNGDMRYHWVTMIDFNYGNWTGKAKVVLDIDIKMGIMGMIVQKEFVKKTPYDANGAKPWRKTAWNPSNWSFNTKLDALAFVFFVIAGFFSDGAGWIVAARYISWGAYATVVGINAYDYIKQGKHDMAGIHILFEALMFMKPLKWFKGGVEWLKTTKGITWAATKISTGIKYIRLGFGKSTVTSAKPTLELMKKHPGARRMIRILAEGGEAELKILKSNLKRAGTYKEVTKEMAEEFIKAITKANPEFVGKITIIQARKIIAQGSKRTQSRILQALVSIPEMVVSSIILISLYDINMIWFPFQVYMMGLDPKKYKPIEVTPLADLQAYLYEKIGKSDIDFTLPMYDVDGKEIVLQDLFGWWRVKDLITSTKMPDSAFFYDWEMVRASYVASIASPHVKAGNCPTIPKERHALYESNIYTPASEEETMEWEAKQSQGTAEKKYQGVPIQAKKLIGREDVNSKLKVDWVDGWRPEHDCQVVTVEDILDITKKEITDNNVITLPPATGEVDKNKSDWDTYIKDGAKKYTLLNGGECLEIEVGDESYFLCERPVPKTLKWYNTLPPEIKSCLNSLMSSLEAYDSIQKDEETFVDWEPPTGCTELGIDWSEWLGESNVSPE